MEAQHLSPGRRKLDSGGARKTIRTSTGRDFVGVLDLAGVCFANRGVDDTPARKLPHDALLRIETHGTASASTG